MCRDFFDAFLRDVFFVNKIRPMPFSPASDTLNGAAVIAELIRLCRDVPMSGAPFIYGKVMAEDERPKCAAGCIVHHDRRDA